MYKDDNSDKESDYEENLEKFPKITNKSLSTVGFRYTVENQNARPMALRPAQSLTDKLDELRFFNNFQTLDINRTSPHNASPTCPCGCFLRPAVISSFRTREKMTLALHIVTPDVLNYHGYNFEPNQIALLWKKDCRKFLWKGKSKNRKNTPRL